MHSLVLLVSLWSAGSRAFAADVPDALIKAVYLYNFARFTEWPAEPVKTRLTLCVLGDPQVAAKLDLLIGDRPINGRAVSVAALATFRIVQSCHLLYVTGDYASQVTEALNVVSALPVFTVGDGEEFARTGGMAAIIRDGRRLRFAINQDALNRAGLRVSSQVLGLARLVRGEPR